MPSEGNPNKIDPYTQMANRARALSKDEALSPEVRARYEKEAETWEKKRGMAHKNAEKHQAYMAELEKKLREQTRDMNDTEFMMLRTAMEVSGAEDEFVILYKLMKERPSLRKTNKNVKYGNTQD